MSISQVRRCRVMVVTVVTVVTVLVLVVVSVACNGATAPLWADPRMEIGPQLGDSTASPGCDPTRPPPDAAGTYDLSVPVSPELGQPLLIPEAPVTIQGPVIVNPPPPVIIEPPPEPPPPVFAPPPKPDVPFPPEE